MEAFEKIYLDYNSLKQNSLIKSLLRVTLFFYPSNKRPLSFLRKGERLCLCHSIVQKRLLAEEGWRKEAITLMWPELLELRWKAFKKARSHGKSVKDFILRLETYTVYLQILRALKKAYLKKKTSEILTFELGLVGLGVSLLTREENIKSVFMQHGFLEKSLAPLVFDELCLWTSYEKKFFSMKGQGVIRIRFKSQYHFKTKKSTALLALEYPNGTFSLEKMKQIWRDFTPLIKQRFDKVIVREHPRYKNELKEALPFEKDLFQESSLKNSILNNEVGTVISLSSASLVEAYYMGCDCYYLTEDAFEGVNFNYDKFFIKLA